MGEREAPLSWGPGRQGNGLLFQALGQEGRDSILFVSLWRGRRRGWGGSALGRRVGEHSITEGL